MVDAFNECRETNLVPGSENVIVSLDLMNLICVYLTTNHVCELVRMMHQW